MATKKFRYRLERLLKLKEHREKERQKDHAVAQGKVIEQKAIIRRLGGRRQTTLANQRHKLVGSVSVAEALVCSRYLQRLKREQIAGEELLHGLEKEAAERRMKLVEAARERKIFELLKEKQKMRHYQQLEKQDQKETDEIAASNFQRPKRDRR